MKMIEKMAVISNPLGIHARPAALIVQAAARFKSESYFSKAEVARVNGKSIMGLMMLAATQGTHIRVTADGGDAQAAIDQIKALFAHRFGEDLAADAIPKFEIVIEAIQQLVSI